MLLYGRVAFKIGVLMITFSKQFVVFGVQIQRQYYDFICEETTITDSAQNLIQIDE